MGSLVCGLNYSPEHFVLGLGDLNLACFTSCFPQRCTIIRHQIKATEKYHGRSVDTRGSVAFAARAITRGILTNRVLVVLFVKTVRTLPI